VAKGRELQSTFVRNRDRGGMSTSASRAESTGIIINEKSLEGEKGGERPLSLLIKGNCVERGKKP